MYLVIFSRSQILFCLPCFTSSADYGSFSLFFASFCSSPFSFLASCKRYSRREDNSWSMQQNFGKSSRFQFFVTKILSLNLGNCRLKALFSVRTTQESKEWGTRNLLLPYGGQIHKREGICMPCCVIRCHLTMKIQ